MMRKLNRRSLFICSTLISLILNIVMLSSKFNYKIKLTDMEKADKKVFIVKVREVGRRNAKDPRDTIKLKDLSVQSIDDLLTRKSPVRKNKITKIKQRKTAIKNIQFKADEIQSIAGEDSDLILNSGIKFESKKGVPVDELNTQELVYYAFKNRTAIQYKNSVVKNLNILKRDNPNLFRRIKDSIHDMSGKISYDREGNVVNIKITQWSDSNEVQDFFVNALKDIRAIPNPPDGLLDEEGFRATYHLKLVL